MATREAKVRIRATDEASPVVEKAEGRFKKLGSFLKVGLVAGAAAAAAGILLLTKGLSASISAANVQQKAVADSAAAMKSAGEFSAAGQRDLLRFASALQEVTTVGDETALQMFAVARGFTNSNEQAKELTKAALDFSRGAGIAFEEAVRRLGRGVRGSTGDIANFVPEIKNLTKEQLAAGEATKLIAARFKGFAEKEAKTFAGSIQQTKNAFGDLLEKVGEAIIENDALKGVIAKATEVFSNAGPAIERMAAFIGDAISATIKFGKQLGPVVAFVVDLGKVIFDLGKIIVSMISVSLRPYIELFKALFNALGPVFTLLGKIGGVVKTLIGTVADHSTALAFNTDATEKNTEATDKLKTAEEEEAQAADDARISQEASTKAESEAAVKTKALEDAKKKKTEADKAAKKATEAATTAIDEEDEALEELIETEQEAVTATTAFIERNNALEGSLRGVASAAAATRSSFDALLETQGRAAAIQAALDAGGTLVLGGTRLRFAGGGSILTSTPGLASSGFTNLDGTPSRF